jgi:transposase
MNENGTQIFMMIFLFSLRSLRPLRFILTEVGQTLDVGTATVGRVRRRYAKEGLKGAINRRPSSRHYERKIDGNTEAHLIALVCSDPPKGYAQWSLRLLADRLVKLEQVDIESVSHETVRQVLKKTTSSPGRMDNG